MAKFRVGIIGRFGFGKNLLNGQTIKTKILSSALEESVGKDDIHRVDTYGGATALLRLPVQCIGTALRCRNIIILPAYKGIRIIAPLLAICNIVLHRKLHYVVIGGWLPQFLQKRRMLTIVLKSFDAIYVETNTMKSALEAQGFTNVFVLPNCKKLTILSEQELTYPSGEPYKLCTFSRVMKEKGIKEAVNAVMTVNNTLGRQVFTLDIFGQVDESQTEWFESLRKNFPSYVCYKGMVPYDKSVEVLKEYFALLFPTYYEGEGFAGTLIDAYSAGVPVIASDWKYNSELVHEGVGCIYPTGDQNAFVDVLKMAAMMPLEFLNKKSACLTEAEKYQTDKVVHVLVDQINN